MLLLPVTVIYVRQPNDDILVHNTSLLEPFKRTDLTHKTYSLFRYVRPTARNVTEIIIISDGSIFISDNLGNLSIWTILWQGYFGCLSYSQPIVCTAHVEWLQIHAHPRAITKIIIHLPCRIFYSRQIESICVVWVCVMKWFF